MLHSFCKGNPDPRERPGPAEGNPASILMSAPSNLACDVITETLADIMYQKDDLKLAGALRKHILIARVHSGPVKETFLQKYGKLLNNQYNDMDLGDKVHETLKQTGLFNSIDKETQALLDADVEKSKTRFNRHKQNPPGTGKKNRTKNRRKNKKAQKALQENDLFLHTAGAEEENEQGQSDDELSGSDPTGSIPPAEPTSGSVLFSPSTSAAGTSLTERRPRSQSPRRKRSASQKAKRWVSPKGKRSQSVGGDVQEEPDSTTPVELTVIWRIINAWKQTMTPGSRIIQDERNGCPSSR